MTCRASLALPTDQMAASPHFPAFWPEYRVIGWPGGAPPALLALPTGVEPPAGAHGVLWFTPGPWGSPRLGQRTPIVALIQAAAPDPIAAALATRAPKAAQQGAPGIMARLAAARLGGPPGLPDPGCAALGLATRGTALLFDPCDPAQRLVAEAARHAARASGLPLRCFRDPFAAPDAAPLWPETEGAYDPCSLLDGAALLYGQERISALLASAGPPPAFLKRPEKAIATAKEGHGAALVWAARAKPGLVAATQAAGVPLVFLEDGFLRSSGIGAAFRPGGSFVLDHRGPHYDPAQPSDLEVLLNHTDFSAALRARATALQQIILAQDLTKYNLTGKAPVIAAPPGRQRILVPGQVEDDASVLQGGGGMTNLALLRAVRSAAPDAFLIYKPHPDVEAGFRRGRIATQALAGLADHVAVETPIAGLLSQVDALHCLTSLAGFEALLRGLPVTLWGQPFYAGWGLTEDRGPAFPATRRNRRLDLESLIAGALILYPRYIDPVTQLPCPVEVFVERLSRPEHWPLAPGGGLRAAQGWAGRQLARLLRRR